MLIFLIAVLARSAETFHVKYGSSQTLLRGFAEETGSLAISYADNVDNEESYIVAGALKENFKVMAMFSVLTGT